MSDLLLKNCDIQSSGAILSGFDVLVKDGLISQVEKDLSHSEETEVINVEGRRISPGLIDLQVNGAGGAVFQENPTVDALITMSDALKQFGVTSFLPALTGTSREKTRAACEAVATYRRKFGSNGVLGINLEGPFLNPTMAGMADPAFAVEYFPEILEDTKAVSDCFAIMTVAPECVTVEEIAALAESGLTISLGHSAASYEVSTRAFQNGAVLGTHVFNAMSGVSWDTPGLTTAILLNDRVSTSLICDGNHIDGAIAKLVLENVGTDRLYIVSDGMLVGSPVDSTPYNDHTITNVGGKCTTQDGVLAGTGVALPDALKNFMSWTGLDQATAVKLTTANPAKVAGVERTLGAIEPGYVANIVIYKKDQTVETVIDGGNVVKSSSA